MFRKQAKGNPEYGCCATGLVIWFTRGNSHSLTLSEGMIETFKETPCNFSLQVFFPAYHFYFKKPPASLLHRRQFGM